MEASVENTAECNKSEHILLVEDTVSLAHIYETCLLQSGYRISHERNAFTAFERLENESFDLILLDLELPDMNGLDVLDKLHKNNNQTPVIIMTGHGSLSTAIEAMRRGARDFLVKPFSVKHLTDVVNKEIARAMPRQSQPEKIVTAPVLHRQKNTEKPTNKQHKIFGEFIGNSPVMQGLYERINRAAKSTATVFITGESGTGKEICAEAIHKHGSRAGKPFVPLNCAAIPRDLLESELFGHVKGAFTGAIAHRDGAVRAADGGTLFLDEIGEMDMDMQTKLLRFLQNLTFTKVGSNKQETTNVRIICATNRTPVEEINAGRFREDLFYRLHVLPLDMPPLRERGDDVVEIARALLNQYTQEENKHSKDFSNDAENLLREYEWPGNVRQLQNIIRNVIVMQDGDLITSRLLLPILQQNRRQINSAPVQNNHNSAARHMTRHMISDDMKPEVARAVSNFHQIHMPSAAHRRIRPLAAQEREIIENAIQLCRGNIPKAAAELGISPSTIYRKKLGWDRKEAPDLYN